MIILLVIGGVLLACGTLGSAIIGEVAHRKRGALQCMNCGYHREGIRPEDVCPECGKAESRRFLASAVRRKALRHAGAFGVSSMCVFAWAGIQYVLSPSGVPYRPAGWLIGDAVRGDGVQADVAAREIHARMQGGRFSKSAHGRLQSAIVSAQENADTEWTIRLASLLAESIQASPWTEDLQSRFLENAIVPELVVDDALAPGQIEYSIHWHPRLVLGQSLEFSIVSTRAWVDDVPVESFDLFLSVEFEMPEIAFEAQLLDRP